MLVVPAPPTAQGSAPGPRRDGGRYLRSSTFFQVASPFLSDSLASVTCAPATSAAVPQRPLATTGPGPPWRPWWPWSSPASWPARLSLPDGRTVDAGAAVVAGVVEDGVVVDPCGAAVRHLTMVRLVTVAVNVRPPVSAMVSSPPVKDVTVPVT